MGTSGRKHDKNIKSDCTEVVSGLNIRHEKISIAWSNMAMFNINPYLFVLTASHKTNHFMFT